MITALIYFLLFILWLEPTFGTSIAGIKGISLSNLSVFLLILGWLVSVALKRGLFMWNGLYKYLFVFMLILIVSIPIKYITGEFDNLSLLNEIFFLKNWLEPFFLFILVFNVIRDKLTCKKAVFGLIIVLMSSVLVTLLVVSDLAMIGKISYAHDGHWPGFAEPNQYAAYLVLMVPLLFSAIIMQRSIMTKHLGTICAILTTSTIISTGSRGGILAFLASMTIYAILLFKNRIIGKQVLLLAGFAFGLVLAGSLLFLPEWIIDRTKARITFTENPRELTIDTYSSGRIQLWTWGLEAFFERPVFGHGQNAFHSLLEQRYRSHGDTHNMYLKYLVDHGLVGFFAFVLILVHLVRISLIELRKTTDPYGKMLYFSFLSGFLGYCLAMLFVNIYNIWSFVLLYAAVVYRYIYLDREENASRTGTPSISGTNQNANKLTYV